MRFRVWDKQEQRYDIRDIFLSCVGELYVNNNGHLEHLFDTDRYLIEEAVDRYAQVKPIYVGDKIRCTDKNCEQSKVCLWSGDYLYDSITITSINKNHIAECGIFEIVGNVNKEEKKFKKGQIVYLNNNTEPHKILFIETVYDKFNRCKEYYILENMLNDRYLAEELEEATCQQEQMQKRPI